MARRRRSRHRERTGASGVSLGARADQLRREIRATIAHVLPEPLEAAPPVERLDVDGTSWRRLRPIEVDRVGPADDHARQTLAVLDPRVVVAVVANAEVRTGKARHGGHPRLAALVDADRVPQPAPREEELARHELHLDDGM